MYTPVIICLLCMAVGCCALKDAESFSDYDGSESLTIATMGTGVELPGYLETPDQPFYKDGEAVYASEHIYYLRMTASGFQVHIRFLTCNDEGAYRVGHETFHLRVKAQPRGAFYFTAKVDKNKKAAIINPLDGVIRISMLYVQGESRQIWSLEEVWNNKMSRSQSLDGCLITDEGNTFVGYGKEQYQYYVYQRDGQADESCSDVQPAGSPGDESHYAGLIRLPRIELPKLKLLNLTEDFENIKRTMEDYKRSWKSGGSTLQFSVMLPLFTATLMFTM